MKYLLGFVVFLWSMSAVAAQCGEPGAKKWSTVTRLKATTVTFYWTTVYEAPSTVCRVSYQTKSGVPHSFEVWGQPELNEGTSQIVFVSCRDDGCSPDIVVVDITRGELLKTILTINDSQFYLKTKWLESDHKLQLEVERFQNDPSHNRYFQHFECLTTDGIICRQ